MIFPICTSKVMSHENSRNMNRTSLLLERLGYVYTFIFLLFVFSFLSSITKAWITVPKSILRICRSLNERFGRCLHLCHFFSLSYAKVLCQAYKKSSTASDASSVLSLIHTSVCVFFFEMAVFWPWEETAKMLVLASEIASRISV